MAPGVAASGAPCFMMYLCIDMRAGMRVDMRTETDFKHALHGVRAARQVHQHFLEVPRRRWPVPRQRKPLEIGQCHVLAELLAAAAKCGTAQRNRRFTRAAIGAWRAGEHSSQREAGGQVAAIAGSNGQPHRARACDHPGDHIGMACI